MKTIGDLFAEETKEGHKDAVKKYKQFAKDLVNAQKELKSGVKRHKK